MRRLADTLLAALQGVAVLIILGLVLLLGDRGAMYPYFGEEDDDPDPLA